MSSIWRCAVVVTLMPIVVSTAAADEVPPETLAALGLSGLEVIHDDPVFVWSQQHRPPAWYPYDARPYEPGIQNLTPSTRTYLNRRLTNLTP